MEILKSLIGEELNAVNFVMDYVELHFNGPVIRCISDPIVSDEHRSWKFPEEGSRDALCTLIGKAITSVDFKVDEYLRLGFADGRHVRVPLNEVARHQGESLHFVPGLNEPLSVW